MIKPLELPRVLDSHYILHVLHNADKRPVPLRVIANITDRGVTYAMAYAAVTHILPQPCDGLTKPSHLSSVTPEQVHDQPEGSLAAYARQGRKLIYCFPVSYTHLRAH